jgi:hypothetical protein
MSELGNVQMAEGQDLERFMNVKGSQAVRWPCGEPWTIAFPHFRIPSFNYLNISLFTYFCGPFSDQP